MKSIQSTGYSIYFKEDAYKQLDRYLSSDQVSTVFVLVDENTFKFCYPEFLKEFNQKEDNGH